MKKNLGIKTIIITVTLLVFAWGIFLGQNPQASIEAMKQKGVVAGIQENIHLGLDLRGGTHLILQVMVDEAVNSETERTAERLRDDFKSKGIAVADITKPTDRPDQVLLKGVPLDKAGEIRTYVSDTYPDYDLATTSDGNYLLTMKPQPLAALKKSTVSRSIETIRSRVDALGVSEPVIQEHGLGENQILVQLPGVDDPLKVRQIMQETGMLEYRLAYGQAYPDEASARAALQSQPNAVIMPDATRTGQGGYWLISRSAVVSGDDIRSATPGVNQSTGEQMVQFSLKAAAGKRFAAFTGANINNQLAVILNGKVRQVATIRSQIGDAGEISGAFSAQEATDLSKLLESGALPASIRYLEDRTVGATLGAESIRQGVTAGVIGLSLVVVFMLLYYHGAGINANLGLFLNLVILLGFLGFSGATLTLPGIAGVILTIGMGVDSNVLIFERIREELRAGKSPASAVDQGFARAWLTIIDTHITTIVAAIILFLFGTGPVRGFAVTLSFGLAANLFTSVFVSRVIFDAILQKKQRGEALSI